MKAKTANLVLLIKPIGESTIGITYQGDLTPAAWIEVWRQVTSRVNRTFKYKPNKKPRYLKDYVHIRYIPPTNDVYTDVTEALAYTLLDEA